MAAEIQVKIVAGPSLLELMTSLTRRTPGPYEMDMDKSTSVHFTTSDLATSGPLKGAPLSTIPAFSATVEIMERTDSKGERWNIWGTIFDYPEIRSYSGVYNTRTRKGLFNLTK
jgi:hypothetical protein